VWQKKFYLAFLIVLVILLGYLSYEILKPFLTAIAWAVVFSILFYPLYSAIRRYIKFSSLASLLVVLLIVGLVVGPFTYLTILLIQEISALAGYMASGKFTLMNFLDSPAMRTILEKISSFLRITPADLNQALGEQISHWGTWLIGKISVGVRNIISASIGFFIMVLTTFFLLQRGPQFFKKVYDYLPFSERQKGRLIKQVQDIIFSTIYGGVIVALVQGAMGGIAFFLLGVPSPVLWGFVMAITSFLPLAGPFLVWGPASLYLYFQGEISKAIVLAIIGGGGISTIDNFLRPLIIGKRTRLPFLFIFFSVLGGIQLFGLIGFVMGPLVLASFVSVIEIFRSLEEAERG